MSLPETLDAVRSTDAANAEAVARIAAVEPVLVGFEPASIALGLEDGMLGHAGPPFARVEDIPQARVERPCGRGGA